MSDVQARIDQLKSVGVEVTHEDVWVGEVGTPERHAEPIPGTYRHGWIPFTAEEWLSMVQNEGDHYVGGCCGQMSALQDDINYIFRFGGGFDASNLRTVAEVARGHDGFDAFDSMDQDTFDDYVKRFADLDPWEKIGVLFNAVEPALKPNELAPYKHSRDETDKPGNNLMWTLERELQSLTWADMFTIREDEAAQHVDRRKLGLAKIYPLVSELKNLLDQVDIDFEGFAVVSEDIVATNGFGQCVYSALEDAQRVVDITNKVADASEDDPQFRVVPCRVSREDGLVLDLDA